MAMFGPAAQARFGELATYMAIGSQADMMPGQRIPGGFRFTREMRPRPLPFSNAQAVSEAFKQERAQLAQLRAMGSELNSLSPSTIMSPGQTQVIRPSQQQPQRRAQAPQAGASSSLITSTPSPAEVALATTTLLGG